MGTFFDRRCRVQDDVRNHYPARHYVMVDDKLRILAVMKKIWGDRLTTVWPRQGHYALDPQATVTYPSPDITLERIGNLINYDLPALQHEDRHFSPQREGQRLE